MDVSALKNYIKNNEDKLLILLEDVGFAHINPNHKMGDEIRCAWEDGGNPTSVRITKDNLSATCYSKGVEGDIISLISAKLGNKKFPEVLKFIANKTDFKSCKIQEVKPSFGGFYKRIKRIGNDCEIEDVDFIEEDVLNNYMITPSKMFYEDGISLSVQEKYQVGYDVISNRIIVPWRSLDGRLIGLMGRLNKSSSEISHLENKWFPVIPFKKSITLFGYSHNYENIMRDKFIIIGESEKFPQQLESKGISLGLGLGGSNLSKLQERNIKAMFPKRIIVALDEGMNIEKSVEIAERLKMDSFLNNEVYYIDDRNGLYLPKGSKMSISDLPKEDIKGVIKHCAKKV